MRFELPIDPNIAEQLRVRIVDEFSDDEATEFFAEFDKWAEITEAGKMSQVVAILNDQFDICVLEAAEPCPRIVGAFDPAAQTFVLADLVDEETVDPSVALHACAAAIGTTVWSEEYL
jgi:hypothetical protein